MTHMTLYFCMLMLCGVQALQENVLRKSAKNSIASMSLDDLTHSLTSGKEYLFTGRTRTSPSDAMAVSDISDRRTVIPKMCRAIESDPSISDYLTNAWDWIASTTGISTKVLPYPMHSSDYLNAVVYSRITDPSDSLSMTVAGDILVPPDWSETSSPTWNIWPSSGDSINYYFDVPQGILLSDCQRAIFREATLRFKEATNGCVEFAEVSVPTPNVLRVGFIPSNGCYASLGYSPHNNVVNIGKGCLNVATIMHLLGHVLGMAHTDQRPDSHSYVSVNSTNINVYGMSASSLVDPTTTGKYKYVFAPLNNTNTQWEAIMSYVPYEYGSLMHNSKYLYSVNIGLESTIDTVNSNQNADNTIYNSLLGNRGYITELDARVLNEMYQCDRLPVLVQDRHFSGPLVDGYSFEVCCRNF